VQVQADDPAQVQRLYQVEPTFAAFHLSNERLWAPKLLTHIGLTEADAQARLTQFLA